MTSSMFAGKVDVTKESEMNNVTSYLGAGFPDTDLTIGLKGGVGGVEIGLSPVNMAFTWATLIQTLQDYVKNTAEDNKPKPPPKSEQHQP